MVSLSFHGDKPIIGSHGLEGEKNTFTPTKQLNHNLCWSGRISLWEQKQLCFDIFSPLSTSRCPIARQAHRSRVFLRSLPHSGKLERNLETFEPPVYPLLYYVYRNGDGHRYLFTGLSTKSFLVSWLLGMDSCRMTNRERESEESRTFRTDNFLGEGTLERKPIFNCLCGNERGSEIKTCSYWALSVSWLRKRAGTMAEKYRMPAVILQT